MCGDARQLCDVGGTLGAARLLEQPGVVAGRLHDALDEDVDRRVLSLNPKALEQTAKAFEAILLFARQVWRIRERGRRDYLLSGFSASSVASLRPAIGERIAAAKLISSRGLSTARKKREYVANFFRFEESLCRR